MSRAKPSVSTIDRAEVFSRRVAAKPFNIGAEIEDRTAIIANTTIISIRLNPLSLAESRLCK